MIDCQARDTVLGLWNTFNDRLIKQGYIAFELNFTRQLSDEISWIESFQPYQFSNEDYKLLINKPTPAMKFNKKSVREILKDGFSMLTEQAHTIANFGARICSSNGNIKLRGYDNFFENQYNKWSGSEIKMRHIQAIDKEKKSWTQSYEEKKQRFNRKNKEAKQIKDNLPNNYFDSLCSALKQAYKVAEMKEICEKIQTTLKTLCDEQEKLLRIYKKMMEILEEYNKSRNRWVSILMIVPGQASGK